MLQLVIGGAGSGKSTFAEDLASHAPGAKIYIATMRPSDEECRRRIARHQRMRSGKGFDTLERYTDLSGITSLVPFGASVLLECLSNLTANELYDTDGGGTQAVLDGVLALLPRCSCLTVVTNEVFSGGTEYKGDTLNYIRSLAALNRALAVRADRVIEVVCGLPCFLKGGSYGFD